MGTILLFFYYPEDVKISFECNNDDGFIERTDHEQGKRKGPSGGPAESI